MHEISESSFLQRDALRDPACEARWPSASVLMPPSPPRGRRTRTFETTVPAFCPSAVPQNPSLSPPFFSSQILVNLSCVGSALFPQYFIKYFHEGRKMKIFRCYKSTRFSLSLHLPLRFSFFSLSELNSLVA